VASPNAAYQNPLENAIIGSAGRVDEGVDYDMLGGYLSAITYGTVIYSSTTPSGWPGQYVAYRVDPGIGLGGAIIYYAEGISGIPPVGFKLEPGDGVCQCTPGASIEIGFGSSNPPNSWARQYSLGYDQVNSTGAGIAFNDLLGQLGARQGIVQGHQLGARPPYGLAGGGGVTSDELTQGQQVARYNPSTIIRHDFYVLGEHGRLAFTHANAIRRLLADTSHCTMRGAA
jgi:hypothetical protein